MQNPADYEDALRQGLRALGTPEISSDFDSRVIASLAKPETWWDAIVISMKPVFSAMCCSLVVTLAAIYFTLHGPISITAPSLPTMPAQHIDLAVIDQVLDRPNLRADSLQELTRFSAATAAVPESPAHRPPDVRHAWLPTKTLVA